MITDEGASLDLTSVSKDSWQHELREALRRMLWRQAASARHDMMGIERGVDRVATLKLMYSNRTPPARKGILRSILTGAIWTAKKLAKAKLIESSVCPHCGQAEEDELHMWWSCPAWDSIRAQHLVALQAQGTHWPNCLRYCGIMVNEVAALGETLVHCAVLDEVREARAQSIDHDARLDFCRRGEVPWLGQSSRVKNGRLVVYTDGACIFNQDARLRRAGVGIYCCEGDARNLSCTLPGATQTNQRAELYAVLHVLANFAEDVNIHTDSKYVLDGCTRHVYTWRKVGFDISNADLWRRVSDLLGQRQVGAVTFTKVKGHAKIKHVRSGLVDQPDRFGNFKADGLATAGARLHAPPDDEIAVVKTRTLVAMSVQSMMTDIIEARNLAGRQASVEAAKESDELESISTGSEESVHVLCETIAVSSGSEA